MRADTCSRSAALSASNQHILYSRYTPLCKTHTRPPPGLPVSRGQQVVVKQHFHSHTHRHTQVLLFGCSILVLSPLSLFLYGTECFLFCATRTVTLSPASFCGGFCPRPLLAAFSECVVGKCADPKQWLLCDGPKIRWGDIIPGKCIVK